MTEIKWPEKCLICGRKLTWWTEGHRYCAESEGSGEATGHMGIRLQFDGSLCLTLVEENEAITITIPSDIGNDLERWMKLRSFE